MDPHISPEQRRKLAVGLLKSAIQAPPEQKEGLIHAALLNLTSADSGEVQQGAPPGEAAADDHELDLADARAQVRQLIRAALEAPSPEELASFLDFADSFRRLSAWNAYMAYIQRPGASIIASKYEWETVKREVKADAIPIIVLWPRSPIRFVYELADTSPEIDRAADLLAYGLLAFNAVLCLLRDGRITEGYAALLGNSLAHRLDIELRYAVSRDQRDELHAQC